MEIIQIVIDKELLQATDREAKRARLKRSALVREALREYLKRVHYRELERRDRDGYRRHPEARDLADWEGVAAWPED
jgi:metal-responsive CopG/Arc/MetJ family transcriptional regulator